MDPSLSLLSWSPYSRPQPYFLSLALNYYLSIPDLQGTSTIAELANTKHLCPSRGHTVLYSYIQVCLASAVLPFLFLFFGWG